MNRLWNLWRLLQHISISLISNQSICIFFSKLNELSTFLILDATTLIFVESPWATPCLVLNNYIYNCHSRKQNKEYWRCHNYSKKHHAERCRSRCVLQDGKLKTCTGGPHNHLPHTEKIQKMMARNRISTQSSNFSNRLPRLKLSTSSESLQEQIRQEQLLQHIQCSQQEEIIVSSLTYNARMIQNRVRYKTSLKGTYQLVLDGFPYTRHRVRGGTIYWRCVQFRPLKCKARVRTNPVGDRVSIVDDSHNHIVLKERRKKGSLKSVYEQRKLEKKAECQLNHLNVYEYMK